jgi:hypothetical protein
MRNNEAGDPLMPQKQHYAVARLQNLLSVFNAFFNRTATTKHVIPGMSLSIATIVKEAQVIQDGIRHIEEGHFDSQALSDEFAHLTQFAISLPETIAGDGGFWGYALNLVNLGTLKEGAEYCEIEQIENFIWALNEVLAIKREIREQAKEKGVIP